MANETVDQRMDAFQEELRGAEAQTAFIAITAILLLVGAGAFGQFVLPVLVNFGPWLEVLENWWHL